MGVQFPGKKCYITLEWPLRIPMFCLSAREYIELRFASYYQDHMVLQRAPSRAVLWGTSTIIENNITITLQLKGEHIDKVYKTSVRATGSLASFFFFSFFQGSYTSWKTWKIL